MGTQIWGKVHNFGIYRKGGKRCILQLDFPGRLLLIIQKGHIKKSHNFDTLQHYDSEEGLHVSLKFRDGEIDFDADNTEEKYTICRLLGFILQMGQGEDDESIDSGQGLTVSGDQQLDNAEVIKEGLLEKKGNTTITTWNKRKVRLTPGEFSYFKPGEELALNVVQLWQEVCEVKKIGHNGFSFTVRDRVYSFRLSSEYKAMNMTEIVRDEWVVAFQQALNQVPSTVRMFDQPLNGNSNEDPEHIYDVTPDVRESAAAASARNRMQLPGNNRSPGEITAHVTVHLNYVDKGNPAPRKTKLGRRHSSDDHLAMSDTVDGSCLLPNADDPSAEGDDPFTGSAAAYRAKLALRGGKSSSLKAYRAQKDFKKKHGRSGGSSHSRLKTFLTEDQTLLIGPIGKADNERLQSNGKVAEEASAAKKSVSDSASNKSSSPAASSSRPPEVMKRMMTMPPPPLPPTAQSARSGGAPPLSPTGPPPPPPLMKHRDLVKLQQVPNVKLKQVHWVKVNSNQISASMWRNARDMTGKLDLAELEEQFCLVEKKTISVKSKPVEDKQMLIDAKRAQNLGILFCGLKPESLAKLTEALYSTTEVDSFPADKMATLKRYQPTTEDREMYKLYTDKRETLHNVDHFMLELCEIPRLGLRLDLILILWEFPDQHASLEEEVNDLVTGCEEILASSDLTTVLEYLLAIGNYMNSLWNAKQGTQGFQISSIDKVLNVKGLDSQTTLCTYLVKQLKRNQPELTEWPKSMSHVSKCAGYSIKAVGAEIDVLKNDLQKIKKILKNIRSHTSGEEKTDKKFLTDVQNFIVEYDRKMVQLDAKYAKVTDKYKQMLIRFGEHPNKSSDSSVFAWINQFMEQFNQAVAKMR